MSRVIFTAKDVKTRKDHRCWGCGVTIPAGTVVYFVDGVDNGKFWKCWWCPCCESVMGDKWNEDDDIWFLCVAKGYPDELAAARADMPEKAFTNS